MWLPLKLRSLVRPHALNLILLLAVSGFSSALADLKVGQPFPDLTAFKLEGALPALKGQVVLLDFWASWCTPCKASFPAYSALHNELAPRGFTLLAVSVDQAPRPYAEFIRRLAPTFPTVRDAEQKLVSAVSPPAMPTCYLLDRQGVLRLIHTGFQGESDLATLRSHILPLLDEKP